MSIHLHTQAKHGFSLIEVLVSAFLIIVLLIGVFRVNSFLSDNNKNIVRSTLLDKYGQYISAALRGFSPGDVQGVFFLVLSNNTLSYSTDPLDKKTSAGFFTPEDPYVSEQIEYMGSRTLL